MADNPGADQLDMEIMDAFGELFERVTEHAERLAQRYGMPAFCAKALHMLDASMAMKDLGKRMHCDPSFITGIADILEKQGLAHRKPGSPDRRVKKLELTDEGLDMKQRIETEFITNLPWRGVLDESERRCLLTLIRKMSAAAEMPAAETRPAGRAPAAREEVVGSAE
jgi:DNA-binding MarR family transcriptional regulator